MDFIDAILKSQILSSIVDWIKNLVMSILPGNEWYVVVILGLSLGIAFWVSGKAVARWIHVAYLGFLVYLAFKYIGF